MKVFNKRMQNKTFVVVTDNIIEKKKLSQNGRHLTIYWAGQKYLTHNGKIVVVMMPSI